MAETQQAPETEPTNEQPKWEAAQYEAALAHLERLQEQLDNLRSTIPSLISPLVRQHTNKAQMFVEIKKAAITSTSDIKRFQDDRNSEQTQTLFAKSKESAEKDNDLSKANDVPSYGWTTQTS